MPFTHPVPDWNAQGVEPPESLKTNGWQVGQKPPADFFNWYFYNSAKALIELQLNAVHQDEISGLVQDASTTQKGVVQLSNSTTSTSEVLAATPSAVKAINDKTGDLSTLMTDNKTNLVGAMNEVTQGFYETYWNVGDIANLNTVAKGSVVSAVNEVNSKTGSLSSLNTTAKTNLVAAVNELFTFANDGKSKWSSVIGSPLVSGDTFTQMQSKTQTIKNTLATNLTEKGQASTGAETLTALVAKVSNVATGKKWASGTVTSSSSNEGFYRGDGYMSYIPSVVVTGLTFKPTTIYLISIYQNRVVLYREGYDGFMSRTAKVFTYSSAGFNGWTENFNAGTSPAYVNATSFKLPAPIQNTSYSWIAYE